MKNVVIISALILALLMEAGAQTAQDALRFSRIYYAGTSRFMGTAGAFGAVGADFSILATNPAGLGLYRSSELTISPSFFGSFISSSYNGYNSNDSKINFALSNVGYIYTFHTEKSKNPGGLKSISVGFGMNRQNDFNSKIYARGPNHTSSLLNSFTDILNTPPVIDPHEVRYYYPFDIGLAYDCGLIFYDSLQHNYLCDMPKGGVFQDKILTTQGSINEFDISLGGNVADKVYFGFTIGIPSIRYFYESRYWEEDTGDSIPYFKSLQYDYNYETHGTGVNFKIGLIYRPADWIRIGAAIHTPTWYPTMYDYYISSMHASYDSVLSYPKQYSPEGIYNYQMMTPFRAIGSMVFIVGNFGFISGEYEYVNYDQARFRATGDSFSDVNSEITNDFKAPLNIRFGTEWRIKKFRIRGGFAYNGSPDKTADFGDRYTVTGGFGLHLNRFFADAAYQWSRTEANLYFYNPTLVNPVDLIVHNHSATVTVGFKF